MKLVMTLMRLDQEVWWVDFKEVLSVLGPLIAGISLVIATFTYRRNTDVRAQDVKANKIKRTHELMTSYPGDVREKVLFVTKHLREGQRLSTRCDNAASMKKALNVLQSL